MAAILNLPERPTSDKLRCGNTVADRHKGTYCRYVYTHGGPGAHPCRTNRCITVPDRRTFGTYHHRARKGRFNLHVGRALPSLSLCCSPAPLTTPIGINDRGALLSHLRRAGWTTSRSSPCNPCLKFDFGSRVLKRLVGIFRSNSRVDNS